MPLLEVLYASDEPLSLERKRAFAREAVAIFHEVLGTPPGRLRLVIHHLKPDDSLGLLEEGDAGEAAQETDR
jgi:phenylpyruvate tautomerase PptA (4-oxalocrotonate tautomerase family)